MKHLKKFEDHENINRLDFGVINIHIDGKSINKHKIINDIKDVLAKYQGEKHLFVDDEEVNPHNILRGL